MHDKSSTFRRTTSKKFSGVPDPTPTLFNKFTPMNSCDVFLYSVARPMFILATSIFCFSWGPTNEGVQCTRAPQNLATPLVGWDVKPYSTNQTCHTALEIKISPTVSCQSPANAYVSGSFCNKIVYIYSSKQLSLKQTDQQVDKKLSYLKCFARIC